MIGAVSLRLLYQIRQTYVTPRDHAWRRGCRSLLVTRSGRLLEPHRLAAAPWIAAGGGVRRRVPGRSSREGRDQQLADLSAHADATTGDPTSPLASSFDGHPSVRPPRLAVLRSRSGRREIQHKPGVTVAATRAQPVGVCNGSPRSGWLVALEAKVRRTAGKCSNIISCCRILRAAFTLYAQQPVPRKSARALHPPGPATGDGLVVGAGWPGRSVGECGMRADGLCSLL